MTGDDNDNDYVNDDDDNDDDDNVQEEEGPGPGVQGAGEQHRGARRGLHGELGGEAVQEEPHQSQHSEVRSHTGTQPVSRKTYLCASVWVFEG